MFDTTLIEVAIALCGVYLLLSLMVTALFEAVSSWGRYRHKELWIGLQNMLGSAAEPNSLSGAVMNHPLVKSISSTGSVVGHDHAQRKVLAPSQISPRLFSTVLLDLMGFAEPAMRLREELRSLVSTYPDTGSVQGLLAAVDAVVQKAAQLPTPNVAAGLRALVQPLANLANLADLRTGLLAALAGLQIDSFLLAVGNAGLGNDDVRTALGALVRDSGADPQRCRQRIEEWFEESMIRTGSRFRRRAQGWTLIFAAGITLALNADTIAIVRKISGDSALRKSLVAQAEKLAAEHPQDDDSPAPIPSPGSPDDDQLVFRPNPVTAGVSVIGRFIRNKASDTVTNLIEISPTNAAISLSSRQLVISKGVAVAEFAVSIPATNRAFSVGVVVGTGTRPATAQLQVRPTPELELADLHARMGTLGLPIGWENRPDDINLLSALGGWAMTIAAVSLGAPFWFNLLGNLLQLRGALQGMRLRSKSSPESTPDTSAPGATR